MSGSIYVCTASGSLCHGPQIHKSHYAPPIELNNKASDIRSDSLIGLNYRRSVYHTNMCTLHY